MFYFKQTDVPKIRQGSQDRKEFLHPFQPAIEFAD
jgi:hypothetical protein